MSGLSDIKAPVPIAALFASSSITSIVIAIFFYIRNDSPWLAVYPAAGTWSGIALYSYLIFAAIWVVGYLVLRNSYNEVGKLSIWVAIFIISVIIAALVINSQLDWSSLSG